MAKKTTSAPKLDATFLVRMTVEMDAKLDARVERERERNPGRTISKADVVREILHRELNKGDHDHERSGAKERR